MYEAVLFLMLLSSQRNMLRCCIVMCTRIGAWYQQVLDKYDYEYNEQVLGPIPVSVHP